MDGDPPAAYRYTEARMAKMANEMLREIEKDTVDWDPNFDETRKEPRVLPSRFPNLLVNGSAGIAVGMATNIPPHNLKEVIDAAVLVLDDPACTLSDLMECIHGPDFPTKGIIMGRSGIRAAYATGRGRLTLRARTELEEFGQNRTRILVTELPYQVNKKVLIETIADQVHDKRLEGISGLRDESDRKGMRIVIELKKDANPQVVLNRLFSQTQLQTTFAINMLALVNNQRQPRILSLRHILDEYLTFQEEVIVRRTRFDLKKAQERAHLLEGLLIAQDNIDEVIRIIRESYDNAKDNLMQRFGLSDVQAQAILDMQLKRLQGLEKEKLQAEYDELEKKIAYYQEILADEIRSRPFSRTSSWRSGRNTATTASPRSRTWRTKSTSKTSSRRRLAATPSRAWAISSACPRPPTAPRSAAARRRHRPDLEGGGLCEAAVRCLHPRLPPLLLQYGQGAPPQGLPHPRGRPHRPGHGHRERPAPWSPARPSPPCSIPGTWRRATS